MCPQCELSFTKDDEAICLDCKLSKVCDGCNKPVSASQLTTEKVEFGINNIVYKIYCRLCHSNPKCLHCKCRKPIEDMNSDKSCKTCESRRCTFCKQIHTVNGYVEETSLLGQCVSCESDTDIVIRDAILEYDGDDHQNHLCIGCDKSIATTKGFCRACYEHVRFGVCCSCKVSNDELNAIGHCRECELDEHPNDSEFNTNAYHNQYEDVCIDCEVYPKTLDSDYCNHCKPDRSY